jgi:hypothetical protein
MILHQYGIRYISYCLFLFIRRRVDEFMETGVTVPLSINHFIYINSLFCTRLRFFIHYSSNNNEWKPNNKNTIPPHCETVFSLILAANIRPPIHADAVQTLCPMIPPTVTPIGFLALANAMVAIWLRSPHSATNVKVNAVIITD